MMFDKEIEAIAKCTELIKDLDDEAKVRVMKYLIERFGIGFQRNASFGSNEYSNQEPKQIKGNNPEESVEYVEEETSDKYPTLKDLMIKDYPKTEAEWILCYAFYSSNFGNDTFKKDDIAEKYKENNRYTDSARANLGNNINACVKKDWIKSVNDTDFVMKSEGITYVKQVIAGNSIGKERKPTKRKNNKSED